MSPRLFQQPAEPMAEPAILIWVFMLLLGLFAAAVARYVRGGGREGSAPGASAPLAGASGASAPLAGAPGV